MPQPQWFLHSSECKYEHWFHTIGAMHVSPKTQKEGQEICPLPISLMQLLVIIVSTKLVPNNIHKWFSIQLYYFCLVLSVSFGSPTLSIGLDYFPSLQFFFHWAFLVSAVFMPLLLSLPTFLVLAPAHRKWPIPAQVQYVHLWECPSGRSWPGDIWDEGSLGSCGRTSWSVNKTASSPSNARLYADTEVIARVKKDNPDHMHVMDLWLLKNIKSCSIKLACVNGRRQVCLTLPSIFPFKISSIIFLSKGKKILRATLWKKYTVGRKAVWAGKFWMEKPLFGFVHLATYTL